MSWNLMPKISNFSNFFVKPTQNLFLREIDVWIVKVKLMISSSNWRKFFAQRVKLIFGINFLSFWRIDWYYHSKAIQCEDFIQNLSLLFAIALWSFIVNAGLQDQPNEEFVKAAKWLLVSHAWCGINFFLGGK